MKKVLKITVLILFTLFISYLIIPTGHIIKIGETPKSYTLSMVLELNNVVDPAVVLLVPQRDNEQTVHVEAITSVFDNGFVNISWRRKQAPGGEVMYGVFPTGSYSGRLQINYSVTVSASTTVWLPALTHSFSMGGTDWGSTSLVESTVAEFKGEGVLALKSIYDYVSGIEYTDFHTPSFARSVNDVIQTKKGRCDDKALTFATLVGKKGFDVSIEVGFTPNLILHAWNRIQVDGNGVSLDTTGDAFFYDSGNIRYYTVDAGYIFNGTGSAFSAVATVPLLFDNSPLIAVGGERGQVAIITGYIFGPKE